MSRIAESLQKLLQSIVMQYARGFWREFQTKRDKIPFWKLVGDFLFVARGLWLFLIFDALIFVFFLILPQGRDILLAVLENTGKHFWWTIIFLALGTLFWGVVAEFGARYTMYVTDNSGLSLSDERVEWRKFVQKTLAGFSLYYPPVIILVGLTVVALTNYPIEELKKRWDILLILGLFYLVLALLYNLYSKAKNKDMVIGPANGVTPREPEWLQLPEEEKDWVSKLYGIYNHYVFMYPADQVLRMMVPRPEVNPFDPHVEPGVKWGAEATAPSPSPLVEAFLEWPQIAPGDDNKPMVNSKFRLFRFSKRLDDLWGRWFYRVPLSFYQVLHRQLLFFVIGCGIILLLFSLFSNSIYQGIGAAGLVCFSFGAWCGVYIGLLFLDKAPLKVKLNYRLLLFLWMLVCSWVNNDHPVRIQCCDQTAYTRRPPLKDHFAQWFGQYHQQYYAGTPLDSAKGKVFPVLFVCAEGGACRTGAFTAMMLSKLQERYHTLNDRIYAYSSVSGGSVGVGFYNAISNFRQPANGDYSSDSVYTSLTKDFFSRDYLAAALGKLFFCEIIQLFWPVHVEGFDRAIALEKAWEWGYEDAAVLNDDRNIFGSNYFSVFAPGKRYPAWFINTTCVETGRQCWLANVTPDSLMPLAADRDLWRHLNGTTLYSTAINFSTRFPIVSPSAEVGNDDLLRRHYVDGGYFENYGAQTMADILYALSVKDSVLFRHVRPVVLMLEYGNNDNSRPPGVRFGNEWADILTGIYETRDGRGSVALANLQYLTDSLLGGNFIEVPLNESAAAVPLNWLLSAKSVDSISTYCDRAIKTDRRLDTLKEILKH